MRDHGNKFTGDDRHFPYDFNPERIVKSIAYYVSKGRHDEALNDIEYIEEQYFLNRDKCDLSLPRFKHLDEWDFRSIKNAKPGGSEKVADALIIWLWEQKAKLLKKTGQGTDKVISDSDLDQLVEVGKKAGWWDEKRKIKLKRNDSRSSGKKFLGQLSICLRKDQYKKIQQKFSDQEIAEFFCKEFPDVKPIRGQSKGAFREFRLSADEKKIQESIKEDLVKFQFPESEPKG